MEIILQVWMAAVKATVAFVMQVDNNIRGHFLDVLPLLLEVSLLTCFVKFTIKTHNHFLQLCKAYEKEDFLKDTI